MSNGRAFQTSAVEAASGVRDRIRAFIAGSFYVAADGALSDGASLLEAGVIDSTGVLEVIGFLEKEFGITVADDEVVPENLDSIERIANFVTRKNA
jgi:acyl carrier protein